MIIGIIIIWQIIPGMAFINAEEIKAIKERLDAEAEAERLAKEKAEQDRIRKENFEKENRLLRRAGLCPNFTKL